MNHPFKIALTTLLLVSAPLLSSCDNITSWDDDDDDDESGSLSGIFLDSPVHGLSYLSDTRSGTTNSNGQFSYEPEEEISFSIGDIQLGTALGEEIISPLQLVIGADSVDHPSITNLLRFLQTLDKDGDSANGIEISSQVRNYASQNEIEINFHQPIDEFETDTTVIDFISANTNTNVLIDTETARTHFSSVMTENRLKPLSANKMRYKVIRNIDPRETVPFDQNGLDFVSTDSSTYNLTETFTLNDSFGFPHTVYLYYVKEPLNTDDVDTSGLPNTWSLYVEVGDDAQQVGGSDEDNPTAARFVLRFGTDGKLSSNGLLVANNWTPRYNNAEDSARPLGPDTGTTAVNDPPSSSNFEIDVRALKFGEP